MGSAAAERNALELAGLVDPDTGERETDRPVEVECWNVPQFVEVWRPGDVCWAWGAQQLVSAGPGLLEGFVGLADGSDERIRDYARRWGVLEICEHGLPRFHRPDPEPPDSGPRGCRPIGWRDDVDGYQPGYFVEPTAAWRRLAARTRAALLVTAAVREGEPIARDAWRVLADDPRATVPPPRSRTDAAMLQVAAIVHDWQDFGRVRTRCLPIHDPAARTVELTAVLGGEGLAGGIALQLLATVTKTDPFAFCSGCGALFGPRRRSPGGDRRYCADCRGAGKDRRDASRDYYARRRRLSTSGLTAV